MALAEWGRWADEIDPITIARLIRSYTKRQQWLARVQAIEVARVLFGEPGPTQISASEMLAMFPQAK